MVNNFRISPDHAADLASVIADVRRRAPGLPVWLIGTSRGSISAASIAARLPREQGGDGLVLTSSVTRASYSLNAPSRDSVMDVDLAAIHVPTLIVNHRGDACEFSSPADAPRVLAKLTAAPRKEIVMFDGGDPPRSSACEAYAQHGYIGIEDRVVGAIVDWILAPKS